ncbi:MAG: DUF354 domain-containing protein [Methanomassiliicoccus sp.]|nr:DUF354 domain-containing protein [Methanomassiliicoccus sp.]
MTTYEQTTFDASRTLGEAAGAMPGPHTSRRIGIIVNTPAQVHFYRHIYENLLEHGHHAFIIAREQGETMALLREYQLPYEVYTGPLTSKMGKVMSLPRNVLDAASILKKHRVDLITGFGVYDAYTSALLGVPNVIFSDNEPSMGIGSYALQFRLYFPFVDSILTPSYYKKDLGEKHIRIQGIKEMAYLHPSRYTPDPSVYESMGLSKGERYSLLRFNCLDAIHDIGVGGFNDDDKRRLVKELENYGQVFISSEKCVPRGLEDHVIKIPKNRIHDALFYATLLVTDTGTMATEAALLGTPTVRCASYVGVSDLGNFIELEKKYHLLFNYRDSAEAIARAAELIKDDTIKAEWARRRQSLYADNVDVCALMTWYIENYPESYDELRNNPNLQERYR